MGGDVGAWLEEEHVHPELHDAVKSAILEDELQTAVMSGEFTAVRKFVDSLGKSGQKQDFQNRLIRGLISAEKFEEAQEEIQRLPHDLKSVLETQLVEGRIAEGTPSSLRAAGQVIKTMAGGEMKARLLEMLVEALIAGGTPSSLRAAGQVIKTMAGG